jgi:predicted secreted protein
MAETVGVDFLLKGDSNTIGGKEDATLNLESDSNELAPTQSTGTQYARRLKGLKDWSIDYDALWIENSDALSGFAPTITVNPSGTSAPTLNNVSEASITLEREAIEFSNSSHSEYVAREPSIIRASAEISVDVDAGTFYSSSTASRLLMDAWESTSGREDVEIALPAGNTSFSSTWIISDVEFATPTDDATTATFSLESDGTITDTISANLGTGLDTLISQIFASSPSQITALLSTGTTGNIEFSGPAWHSETEITIPVEGAEDGVSTSGSLVAADALTIQDTP